MARILLFLTILTGFSCLAEIQTETALTPAALLQNAIKDGQLEEVKLLIEQGIEVNQPSTQGVTPLHHAVIHNQTNIAAVLLQAGAKVDVKDAATEATPLHLAALYGREDIANLLITKGANVNATMKFGITPLLVAAQFNQPQIVRLLSELPNNKVAINHADQEGFTALHFAAQNGDVIIARLLIDRGANVNLRDKTNQATPLTIAIENNHLEMVQLLKDHGAN